MIRALATIVVVLLPLAAFIPDVRTAVAWVLAFFSLLMLGDLIRSSVAKSRGRR